MKLTVVGAGWKTHILLAAAGHYFATKLRGFRLPRVRVKAKLVSGLRKKEKCVGAAYQDSPFSYQVKIDASLKPLVMVRCLAHEMIHINQWLTGDMRDVYANRWKVLWKKRVYTPAKLAYRKHPWERQAAKWDNILAQSFIDIWKTR